MKSKHPIMTILTAIIVLGIGTLAILELLRTEVVLVDGGTETKIVTFGSKVQDVVAHSGLKLKPLDEVYPKGDTEISEGLRIVIKRFRPIVVEVNDKAIEVYERNLTAQEVLRRAGVTFGGTDTVNVSMDRIIKSGEHIVVYKEEKSIVSVEREEPFKNETIRLNTLNPGERRIQQFGVMGKYRDYYEIVRRGGEEIGRTLVKTEEINPPITQILAIGPSYVAPKKTTQVASKPSATGSGTAAGEAANAAGGLTISRSKSFAYKTSYVMIATAYDLSFASTGKSPGMPGYGITASGTQARVGAVAVDPSVIPLGTKLYIEYADGSGGYGYATAEDTGSAIKGYRIDLFFNTYQECINFGRKRVIVYVLE